MIDKLKKAWVKIENPKILLMTDKAYFAYQVDLLGGWQPVPNEWGGKNICFNGIEICITDLVDEFRFLN